MAVALGRPGGDRSKGDGTTSVLRRVSFYLGTARPGGDRRKGNETTSVVRSLSLRLRCASSGGLRAAGGGDVAFDDAPGAFTITVAPSFRLSKRAASTGTFGGSAVLTSTTPASSSRRPSSTMRRTSLPLSIVHTKLCPASVRIAVSGSVGVGVGRGDRDAAASRTCRCAASIARIGQRDVDVERARARLGRGIDPLDATGELAIAEAFDGELDRPCRP